MGITLWLSQSLNNFLCPNAYPFINCNILYLVFILYYQHTLLSCPPPCRIETVLGCDRILVMEAGGLMELDTPTQLLANKQSLFYKLYKEHTS